MWKKWLATLLGLILTFGMTGIASANTGNTPSIATGTVQTLVRLGTTAIITGNSSSKDTNTIASPPLKDVQSSTKISSQSAISGPQLQSSTPLSQTNAPFVTGFDGLTHKDQLSADNGNQHSVEPPDQGLCTNGHVLLETVNNALAIYTTSGILTNGPTALNPFFGLNSEIITGATNIYGQFTSDPKCYYDQSVSRWYITILEADTNSANGSFTGQTHIMIAVSQTGDPSEKWSIFSINSTDDGTNGTPSHPNCPCLGDQPLLGSDLNGIYITTNEFGLSSSVLNGAQVYGISKALLAQAASNNGPLPSVAHIDASNMLAAQHETAFSLQPVVVPPGGDAGITHKLMTSNNGTEYFLSTFDMSGYADTQIVVWALTNTAALAGSAPALALQETLVTVSRYEPPNAAQQASGPTPLRDAINNGTLVHAAVQPLVNLPPTTEPLLQIDTNDDRMMQVVMVNGHLWGALNTGIMDYTHFTSWQTGIEYFEITPAWSTTTLSASVVTSNYVNISDSDVFNPAIAVSPKGIVAIGFTVTNGSMYPSAGYVILDATGKPDLVHVDAQGAAPEDGFSGYYHFGGNGIARWGDYSAAVVAPDGTFWLATEYIPNAPRSQLANWGTRITHIAFTQRSLYKVVVSPPTPPVNTTQHVILTARVTTKNLIPTGNVMFYGDTALLGTATLVNGIAKVTTSFALFGNTSVTAVYSDGTPGAYAESQPISVSVVDPVRPYAYCVAANQDGTYTAHFGYISGSNAVIVVPTDNSNGTNIVTPSLQSNGSLPTLVDGTLQPSDFYAGLQSDVMHVKFTGSISWNLLGQTATITPSSGAACSPGNIPTVTLASSSNPSTFGQTVIFTATITTSNSTAVSGNMLFYAGTILLGQAPINNQQAVFSISTLTVGTHSIIADYPSIITPSTFPIQGALSAPLKQVVKGIATTTTLVSSLNPSTFGQQVIFTAKVSSASGTPTGSVNFLDGKTILGSATLTNGVATFATTQFAVGTHKITAEYTGKTPYSHSFSIAVNQVVNP